MILNPYEPGIAPAEVVDWPNSSGPKRSGHRIVVLSCLIGFLCGIFSYPLFALLSQTSLGDEFFPIYYFIASGVLTGFVRIRDFWLVLASIIFGSVICYMPIYIRDPLFPVNAVAVAIESSFAYLGAIFNAVLVFLIRKILLLLRVLTVPI